MPFKATESMNEKGMQLGLEDEKPRCQRVYIHISIRTGLCAGQRSALGHRSAALTHLTAKIIPLVSHGAMQRTVSSQVRAGVI